MLGPLMGAWCLEKMPGELEELKVAKNMQYYFQ
jgi:hypothetical protein